MGSAASVRRFGASLFILLLALMLYGIKPADSSAQAQVRPTPSSPGPRPTQTNPGPRPTPTSPSPRPTPTDPYPAGIGLPGASDADSFFRVADTEPAPGTNAATTMLWIFVVIAAVGLSLRWFLLASRQQRDG